jgi:multidrug efflux system membrane fusion protein
MVRLRADFPNGDEALFPDQFVNVRLLEQEKQGVTLITSAAVQRTTSTTYVYVVKPDSSVTVRQVVEGTSEGDDTEIVSGLEPGDVVVMSGVDRLNEGSKVTVQFPGDAGGRGRGQGRGSAQGAGTPVPGGATPQQSPDGHKGRGRGRGGEGKGQ